MPLRTKLCGQGLTSRIPYSRIRTEPAVIWADRTQICEWADEVSQQRLIANLVVEMPREPQFAGPVKADFFQRGQIIERTIPSTTPVIIEAVAIGACVQERSVDMSTAPTPQALLARAKG